MKNMTHKANTKAFHYNQIFFFMPNYQNYMASLRGQFIRSGDS